MDRKNTGVRTGLVLFCIGTLLIFCAAGFGWYNLYTMKEAGRVSADIVCRFEEIVLLSGSADTPDGDEEPPVSPADAGSAESVVSAGDTAAPESSPAEPMIIDGRRYMGILSIPALELKLPVCADLSYPALRKSPCRYRGSAEEGGFVIAAHNYTSHFGRLNKLANGECIRFTDTNGKVTEYVVIQSEVMGPFEVERMVDSGYDLTLFTCTPGGRTRAAVRCMKGE